MSPIISPTAYLKFRRALLQLPVVIENGSSDETSSQVFSSASPQESVPEVETSQEWQATPQVRYKLHSLNNFLRNCCDARVSPVWSQLCTDALKVSFSAGQSLLQAQSRSSNWDGIRSYCTSTVNVAFPEGCRELQQQEGRTLTR